MEWVVLEGGVCVDSRTVLNVGDRLVFLLLLLLYRASNTEC